VKDRASPFSRKHRRYWLTTAGGMVLIMSLNLGLGFGLMRCKTDPPPKPDYRPIPPVVLPPDAGVDAAGEPGADAAVIEARDAAAALDALLPDQIER
jgi:hypothetical protein